MGRLLNVYIFYIEGNTLRWNVATNNKSGLVWLYFSPVCRGIFSFPSLNTTFQGTCQYRGCVETTVCGMYVNCDGSGRQDILKNKKIIAVNQDPLGIQGRRIYKQKGETFLDKTTITFHKFCAENISVNTISNCV